MSKIKKLGSANRNYAETMTSMIFDAEQAIDMFEDFYVFNNSDQFEYEVYEETNVITYYVPYYVDLHNLHKKICDMLMAKYGSDYNEKYVIVYDYVAPEDGMPAYERIHGFKAPGLHFRRICKGPGAAQKADRR